MCNSVIFYWSLTASGTVIPVPGEYGIIRFEVKYEEGSPKGALRILISRSRLNLVVRYFERPGGGLVNCERIGYSLAAFLRAGGNLSINVVV